MKYGYILVWDSTTMQMFDTFHRINLLCSEVQCVRYIFFQMDTSCLPDHRNTNITNTPTRHFGENVCITLLRKWICVGRNDKLYADRFATCLFNYAFAFILLQKPFRWTLTALSINVKRVMVSKQITLPFQLIVSGYTSCSKRLSF